MNTFDKVIFVCNGNTCRSPMAATVMANLKQDIISAVSYTHLTLPTILLV